MTLERREKYLQAIRETANYIAAARIASPSAKGPNGAISTFNKLRQDDPEFDAACKAAMEEALDTLEAVVYERARNGTVIERRITPDGGAIERYAFDTKRELAVLARHRSEWRQSHNVDVNAAVAAVGTKSLPFNPLVLEGLTCEERIALRTVLVGAQRVQALIERARTAGVEPTAELLRSGGLEPAIIDATIAQAKPVPTLPNHERYSE